MANAKLISAHDASDLPPSVWERIASSPARLLILDYDGTLVSFQVDRMAARPTDSARAVLRELAVLPGTRTVIRSGRRIQELRLLLRNEELPLIGAHRWEEWSPEGGHVHHQPAPQVLDRLETAARLVEAWGGSDRLEIKRCSVVFHTRGLPIEVAEEQGQCVHALWRPLIEPSELRLDRIAAGLEFRAAARDKGTVVADLSRRSAPGTLTTFLGDDLGDEAAFSRIRTTGIAIRVGRHYGLSAAPWRLDSPAGVEAFLGRWIAAAANNGHAS